MINADVEMIKQMIKVSRGECEAQFVLLDLLAEAGVVNKIVHDDESATWVLTDEGRIVLGEYMEQTKGQ